MKFNQNMEHDACFRRYQVELDVYAYNKKLTEEHRRRAEARNKVLELEEKKRLRELEVEVWEQ